MEDYEIRDIFRRSSTPDLWIDFTFNTGSSVSLQLQNNARISNPFSIRPTIGNHSREPALYAAIRIYIDCHFTIFACIGFTERGTSRFRDRECRVLTKDWRTPSDLPIFSENPCDLAPSPIMLQLDANSLDLTEFLIGYEVRDWI